MGIVIAQSLKNLIYTYIGFAIGALNTLLLYPYFMDEQYYGLINVLLSTAMILYPVLSFGMSSTLIRFYPHYLKKKEQNSFALFSFLVPLIFIALAVFLFELFKQTINSMLSEESFLLKDYSSYVYLFAISIAYFEVFYSYARVHLKTVFGNFLKEVFIRVVVTALLVLLHFNLISDHLFVVILSLVYLLRTLIMMVYSLSDSEFKIELKLPSDYKKVLTYSFFVISSSSVAYFLLEFDKVMLSQYVDLANVAYYAVGGFIGIVVAVPGRAMQQILIPLTSRALAEGNITAVDELYKKSSINMMVISGLIFLIVAINIDILYQFLPEKFRGGEYVAVIISLAKLIDMTAGINGGILSNSKFYKMDFIFGILLVVVALALNIALIPIYSILGAAIATLLSTIFFNILKYLFLKYKMGINPFSIQNFYVFLLIVTIYGFFHTIDLHLGPVISIIINSVGIISIYFSAVLIFKPSPEIAAIIEEVFKKFKIFR